MALVTPEFLFTQNYSAMRDRLALEHGGAIQPGVWGSTDYKVAVSTGMSMTVATGFALVDANSAGNAGLYHVENSGSAVTVTATAAHATLPRIDQVILDVSDSTNGGDAGDVPVLRVLAGTATSGATLDNRTGAAAVPSNCLRLADVLVPAAAGSLSAGNVRDRRPWARGASFGLTHADVADLVLSSTTLASVFTWTVPRMEISSGFIDVAFHANTYSNTTPGSIFFALALNSVAQTSATIPVRRASTGGSGSGWPASAAAYWRVPVTPGSLLIDVWGAVTSGNFLIARSAASGGPSMVISEVMDQNVSNN